MAKINISTAKKVVPMIYAYSTPEIKRHDGWVKIGYTEKQTTEARQKQQSHTIDVILKEEWKGNAVFDDGSGERFHDTDFHAYLRKLGIENTKGTEWFHIDGPTSQGRFYEFRSNRGILKALDTVVPYTLRSEQEHAVEVTAAYYAKNLNGEFLWNAKPRFGKTLSVYDLCKRMNAQNVLIVTNRPAIANSWYSDYVKFLGDESGYKFVSHVDALKGKSYCINRDTYVKLVNKGEEYKCIEFVSLQDLKGSVHFGGEYEKLGEVANIHWDVLVIDEAHEGIDTYKTDLAFDKIYRNYTLHLSGTPFKALANDKFSSDAIFNWTYADEQAAKRDWNGEGKNPYVNLPKLNLYTYQMSEIIKDEIEQGIEIQGETTEYAFDLNEFFAVKAGKFIHESAVDKFLDALTTQEKFPFSTMDLRNELKHTFWLLNRVDSAKLLAKKLEEHPVFLDYKIILAAGDGKADDDDESELKKSFDKVVEAIKENDKTITLSVGQLTTGVTIPEWTAVLMLSSIKSPALYMQAAFRAQNPCLFEVDGTFLRKENAYVFDFDPARTLVIFEQFANDLSASTVNGNGDIDERKKNIRELLNFFPVVGEDENGKMIELDAEKVLSIPRKIKSQEVVRRGFMSDFLFQNISNIFHAPQEVIDILQKLPETKEGKELTVDSGNDLSLNENGEVDLSEGYVIGKSAEVFGDKVFGEVIAAVEQVIESFGKGAESKDEKNAVEEQKELLKSRLKEDVISRFIEEAKNSYGSDLRTSDEKRTEQKLNGVAETLINKVFANQSIANKELELEMQHKLEDCATASESEKVHQEFEEKKIEITKSFIDSLAETVTNFVDEVQKEIVTVIETKKKEQERDAIQDTVRDHLRGFSRTIPSFLMAYGTEDVNLENFDTIIPEDVFLEVTSITIDNFRFLRDGGNYTDADTGEQKYFAGHLFDSVVFADSVKEFMRLKKKLADYFEEGVTEDIFDYIPPQKTNQIFTPKWVVKKMVDMLEEENPHCFDVPDKTFIDLYMKSGLYIAEIVKRLYQSEEMKKIFPEREDRLKHIFKEQVYGLAPTEIIYRISTNFILGFDEDVIINEHNFRKADALPYAKENRLQEYLNQIYHK